jgi:hypothetical protein
MKITVQIAVESTLGQPEVIRQVARLERGRSLVPATLGLSLAEARSILVGREQMIVERPCVEFGLGAARSHRIKDSRQSGKVRQRPDSGRGVHEIAPACRRDNRSNSNQVFDAA